jgi:hypothetical protein
MREIMGKLKLTVNEEKTRICKVPTATAPHLDSTDFLADIRFLGCLVKAKLRSLKTTESMNACFVSVSWRPFVTDRRQNVGHCRHSSTPAVEPASEEVVVI